TAEDGAIDTFTITVRNDDGNEVSADLNITVEMQDSGSPLAAVADDVVPMAEFGLSDDGDVDGITPSSDLAGEGNDLQIHKLLDDGESGDGEIVLPGENNDKADGNLADTSPAPDLY